MIDFKGCVAIVTWAARGIGLATAQHFIRGAAAVVLVDRNGERLARAAERPRGECVSLDADVPDGSQVEAMVEEAWARLGSVDVLVKNAGIAGGAVPRWELTHEDSESVLALNLTGAFYRTCRPAALGERGWGVASMGGEEGNSNAVPSSASKSGMIGLSQAVAKELAGEGIRVSCAIPARPAGVRSERRRRLRARANRLGPHANSRSLSSPRSRRRAK